MRWIGYFDISVFWLAVLLVVVFSMHTSSNVVFEDRSVLLENIENQGDVSSEVACGGTSEPMQFEEGVKAVLTTGGIPENETHTICSSGVCGHCRVTETGIMIIMY